MAEGLTKDIQIIDLQIENLQQKRRLLLLNCQKAEIEGLFSRNTDALSYQVSDVTSFGQVKLTSMDTKRKEVVVADAFQDRGHTQPQPQDNKIVRIQTRLHTNTFRFETPTDWIQILIDEATDIQDEMKRRNCLCKALRQYCGDVVKSIPVQEGLFQDRLIELGCLELEEWKMVTGSRKLEENQIRAIIVIVLEKDFRTTLGFLLCIREMNIQLVDDIMSCYREHVEAGFGVENRCWLCLVEDRVKISILSDKLFSEEMIDKDLYMETSKENLEAEEKKNIWNAVLKRLQQHGDTQKVLTCLQEAIQASCVHKDICKVISEIISQNCSNLQCVCGPQMSNLKVNAFEEKEDDDSGL